MKSLITIKSHEGLLENVGGSLLFYPMKKNTSRIINTSDYYDACIHEEDFLTKDNHDQSVYWHQDKDRIPGASYEKVKVIEFSITKPPFPNPLYFMFTKEAMGEFHRIKRELTE